MRIKNEKGFTLIELVITIAIIALAMPMITQLFMYGFQDFATGTRFLSQQSELNAFYNSFNRDFQMSREIIIRGVVAGDYAPYIELKYDPKPANVTNPPTPLLTDDIAETKFHKKYIFDTFNEELHVIANPDTVTPTTGVLLKMVDSTTIPVPAVAPALPWNVYKSGFFFNLTESKIWVKISMVQINMDLFTARKMDNPVMYYFDFTNKKVSFKP